LKTYDYLASKNLERSTELSFVRPCRSIECASSFEVWPLVGPSVVSSSPHPAVTGQSYLSRPLLSVCVVGSSPPASPGVARPPARACTSKSRLASPAQHRGPSDEREGRGAQPAGENHHGNHVHALVAVPFAPVLKSHAGVRHIARSLACAQQSAHELSLLHSRLLIQVDNRSKASDEKLQQETFDCIVLCLTHHVLVSGEFTRSTGLGSIRQ
jgi:hypothetical protein